MKKKIIYSLILIILIRTGCKSKKIDSNNIDKSNLDKEVSSVKIFINNEEYILDLENNETSKALAAKLPLELNMKELNGNEKYAYIEELPTNSVKPNHINAGDVMLYQDDCLVIFYKSFDTSYSYTKIGRIENIPNLDIEDIKVRIEKNNI